MMAEGEHMLQTSKFYSAEQLFSDLAVIFPEGGNAPAGIPLIPVQLYEAAFEFLAVIVLVIISSRFTRLRPQLLKLYCAAYAVFRFCLEFFHLF